jgi:hypothetical protein
MVVPESERQKLEGGIEKAVSAALQAAREDAELRGKIADFLLQGIDKQKFKERIVEEALKDSELRKKIMLEIVRKLG